VDLGFLVNVALLCLRTQLFLVQCCCVFARCHANSSSLLDINFRLELGIHRSLVCRSRRSGNLCTRTDARFSSYYCVNSTPPISNTVRYSRVRICCRQLLRSGSEQRRSVARFHFQYLRAFACSQIVCSELHCSASSSFRTCISFLIASFRFSIHLCILIIARCNPLFRCYVAP